MLNDRLVLVGVAVLSSVATAGWLRQTPVASMPQATNFTAPMLEPEPMIPVQSAAFNLSGSSVPANRGVYSRTSSTRRAPRMYDDRRVNSAVYDDRSTVAKPRSTAKSAAIIGGGAAAGAAIGAMAGGGKGAAIGAIAGGAGGYVYDRMTKNR